MPLTVVTNNKEALIIGQMPHLGADKAGVPQLGETVTFVPGINLIDSAKLATLRKNPAFEVMFNTLIPRSLAPEQNPEKVDKPMLVAGNELPDKSPLGKLSPKACEAIVVDTLQIPLLKQWLDEEGDNARRAVLERQIKKLSEGAPSSPAAG